MDKQTVVSNIESVIQDIIKLRDFSSLINDYLDAPNSKSNVRDFSEKYLLGNFLNASELRSLYAKLTVEKTLFNSNVVRTTICSGTFSFKEPLTKFKLKVKKTLESVLLLIATINNDVIESILPNKSEVLSILFNQIAKINSIFYTARQLPIEADQLVLLSITDDVKCTTLAELVTYEKDFFNQAISNLDLGNLLNIGSNSTYVVDPFLCKNNWISLRNLIISLDTM